ncbi:MAG: DUF4145 domain-containing protein [Myxococcota bacterium]
MIRTPPLRSALDAAPPPVALLYAEAEGTCALLPGHALVQVRAALAALVDAWTRHLARGTGGTLKDQTDRLIRSLALRGPVAEAFHEVRVAGNLGAHPEQRPDGPPTRDEARDALFKLYGLVSHYAERVAGVDIAQLAPFVEPPSVHWGTICERAIFKDDASAMMLIGRRFRAEATASKVETAERARAEKQSSWMTNTAGFVEALSWFKRATQRTTQPIERRDAMFERAQIMLMEIRSAETTNDAADLLEWAADEGHPDAQSMLAHALMEAKSAYPGAPDMARARVWAERAAEADHPEALNLLVAICADGLGIERNADRALAYARRASEAGYPLAHANLAMLLLDRSASERNEDEIVSLIDRAKADNVPTAWWADYIRLSEKGAGHEDLAQAALAGAADREVAPAMLLVTERGLAHDPAGWGLRRGVELLLRVLTRSTQEAERAEAKRLLRRVRDEIDRRVWRPSERDRRSPERTDELFSLLLQSGALLEHQVGDDSWKGLGDSMTVLLRIQGSSTEPPATREDVERMLAISPLFPVRWTSKGVQIDGPFGAALRAASGAPSPKDTPRPPSPRPQRVARNGPCVCGSGRKYKGCCGKTAT